MPLTGANVPLEVRTKRNYFAAVNLKKKKKKRERKKKKKKKSIEPYY